MKQQESSYNTKIAFLETEVNNERDKAYQRIEEQRRGRIVSLLVVSGIKFQDAPQHFRWFIVKRWLSYALYLRN